MINASGHNDVMLIFHTTRLDEVDYHLAFIGADFAMTAKRPFEQAYMRALFDHAETRAARGFEWFRVPPM